MWECDEEGRALLFWCYSNTLWLILAGTCVCNNDNYTNDINISCSSAVLASGGSGAALLCAMPVITDGLNAVEAQNVKLYRQIHAKKLCTRNEFSQYKPTVKDW